MPMCQSPKIADVFLGARTVPANDNLTAAKILETNAPERVSRTSRHIVVIFFCAIGVLLFLDGCAF